MNRIDSGKQLKTLAVILFIAIALAGCYGSYQLSADIYRGHLYDFNTGLFLAGLIVTLIVAYLSSIMIYAFGDLVENTKNTAQGMNALRKELSDYAKTVAEAKEKVPSDITQG